MMCHYLRANRLGFFVACLVVGLAVSLPARAAFLSGGGPLPPRPGVPTLPPVPGLMMVHPGTGPAGPDDDSDESDGDSPPISAVASPYATPPHSDDDVADHPGDDAHDGPGAPAAVPLLITAEGSVRR